MDCPAPGELLTRLAGIGVHHDVARPPRWVTRARTPLSSSTSRASASATGSPSATRPPGSSQFPGCRSDGSACEAGEAQLLGGNHWLPSPAAGLFGVQGVPGCFGVVLPGTGLFGRLGFCGLSGEGM